MQVPPLCGSVCHVFMCVCVCVCVCVFSWEAGGQARVFEQDKQGTQRRQNRGSVQVVNCCKYHKAQNLIYTNIQYIINPQRACAQRVIVVILSVIQSFSQQGISKSNGYPGFESDIKL